MSGGLCTAVAIAVCGAAVACGPSDPHAVFDARLTEVAGDIVELRRDIHRHPELSGAETRTAALVADRLGRLGFDVRTGVGGHGVVGVLAGRTPGPVVAFRADLDAVRSDAPDPVPFSSEVPGVRHICGHDVHTAIGLALAEGFAATRDDLPGTVVLIFQPAEETATGARAMIDAGAVEAPRPDVIFAVHAAPLEVGQLATAEATLMPARDAIEVTLDGGRRTLALAQQARRLIEQAGTIAPESAFSPVAGAFVFAQVEPPRAAGGTAWSVRAILTVSGDPVRTALRNDLVPALEALDTPATRVRVEYRERMIDGVTNDPVLVARAAASIRRVLGDEAVVMLNTMVPAFSEDFGSFQALVPGVMFFLGVSNSGAGTAGLPHSPDFVADEGALAVGARAIGAAMIDVLTARPSG